jgi:hypothetical protein
MQNSRVKNTITNAKISFIFYLLSTIATFLSRSIFILYFGSGFVGLSSTMMNIIGFFNLAEMGFASVIAFALYDPLHKKDEKSINEILSVLNYVYEKIGYIIVLVGFSLSFFIPFIFNNDGFSNSIILATYFTYLISSLLGFFINYKEVLLAADQKNYIKIRLFNITKLIKIVIQIFFIFYISNDIYTWLFLEIIFQILYSIILNFKINILYPELSSNKKNGKHLLKQYNFIYTKTKQAFFHRACGIILTQSSGILIYMFSSLDMVTKYTNYTLITGSILTLTSSLFDSSIAAVGNLIAEKKYANIIKVFWELQVFRFWIASCLSYLTFTFIDPFILLWVGYSFTIPTDIKIILSIILFIMIVRKTNDEFIAAYGLYKDVWAPLAEAIINISIAIFLGSLIGIVSIPLGTAISLFIIVILWKPIFLYVEQFPQKIIHYFINIIKYLIIGSASLYFVDALPLYIIDIDNKILEFIALASQKSILSFFITWVFFFVLTKEMRSFTKRLIHLF